MSEKERGKKKVVRGVVVSDKMDKTVRVRMVRRFLHPIYKKYVTRRKEFMAHDAENSCGIGDLVLLVESKPVSRNKRWRVQSIVQKAE